MQDSRLHCIVVDDHTMFMQMLCGVLRTIPGLEIVGMGSRPADGPRLTALPRVDLAIIDADSGWESWSEPTPSLLLAHPHVRVIILTNACDSWDGSAAWQDRLVAVIDKTEPLQKLLAAVAGLTASPAPPTGSFPSRDDLHAVLTPRQCEVIDSLAKGMTNKEIARTLQISEQTVETHRKAISKKLGCNGASLIRLATLSWQYSLEPSSATGPRSPATR